MSYDASAITGPRGPGGGPQAPRHVHRLDRRARPAPPGLRGRRQLGRRGAGRLLRHASTSRSCADGGVRVVDNGRGIPVDIVAGRGQAGRRGRADRAARRRQVRRRRLRGLRRSARRRRLGGQRAVDAGSRSRSSATATAGPQAYELGVPDGAARRRTRRPTRPAPRSRSGPTRTSSRPPTSPSRRSRARFQEMAFLNKGLTHRRSTDERESARPQSTRTTPSRARRRSAHGHLPLRGRHRRLRRSTSTPARATRPPDASSTSRPRTRSGDLRLEIACSGTRGYTESRPHLREHDQHPRGRHPRGGLPRGADHAGQQVRARAGSCSRRRTTTSPATTSARA